MADPNIGPNPPWVAANEPKSVTFDNGCTITWDVKDVFIKAVNGLVVSVNQLTGETVHMQESGDIVTHA